MSRTNDRKNARNIAFALLSSAVWGAMYGVLWNLAGPIAALLVGGLVLVVVMIFVVPWLIGPALVERQDRRHIRAHNRVRAQLGQTPGTAGSPPTARRTGSQPRRHRNVPAAEGRHRPAA